MKRTFTANTTQEDNWHLANCLEVVVASQGYAEEGAPFNPRDEAMTRNFNSIMARCRGWS